ncbi:MAG: hypothetical protein ACHP7I_02985 [Terriglobales bacterium]
MYKVVDLRPNESDSSFQPWVKVVLLHDGKKLNARCNNYKAAPNTDKAVPCMLKAGGVINCQAFADRMSEDAGGYDLICGNDREKGKLITSAKNELLQIEDYDATYEAKRKAELAKLPKVPLTIVYDEWWSSDYAANGAEMRCPPATRQMCVGDARSEEAAFLGKFSAAFQSDPTCAGLRLLVYGGPKNTSEQATRALAEINEREHWSLIVDFSPGLQKQPWTMLYGPRSDRRTSGEGDSLSVARSVCEIAKNRGGSVVD